MEAPQSGSFINKPPRGWLHSDNQLAEEGICYGVRYIGALEVNTSMKSLNFDTRSLIAKECISKVCESAGLKTADRKRKTGKTIGRILGEKPLMEHAGSDVTLTITSDCLTLTTLESREVVACHEMPNISFASGGDPDTLDFIAYVAKDSRYGRACFVLECGGGLAQDVITTIGQAFELRFKDYLKRTPQNVQYSNIKTMDASKLSLNGEVPNFSNHDRDYYNDLPGKVPPEMVPPPVPPLPQYTSKRGSTPVNFNPSLIPSNSSSIKNLSTNLPALSPSNATVTVNEHTDNSSRASDNLIDLSMDVSSSKPLGQQNIPTQSHPQMPNNPNQIEIGQSANVLRTHQLQHSTTTNLKAEPAYVNDSIIKQRHNDHKDPFDMQPFSMQLSQLGGASSSHNIPVQSNPAPKTLSMAQRLELQREPWFHGSISRKEAEILLKQDGDFLVRESQGSVGQYVLTGMQNSTKKHLLLVDPEGVVRTKSRTFDSVSHLINYHRNNELPIVSAESALVLRNPVLRAD